MLTEAPLQRPAQLPSLLRSPPTSFQWWLVPLAGVQAMVQGLARVQEQVLAWVLQVESQAWLGVRPKVEPKVELEA